MKYRIVKLTTVITEPISLPFCVKTNSILCFPGVIGKDKKLFQAFDVGTSLPSTFTFQPSLNGIDHKLAIISNINRTYDMGI